MFCIINKVVDGRYQIVTTIGKGGTGDVYVVVDMELNRQLALKILSHNLDQQVSWGRFEREARNASRMNHPNIVRLYDFGLINDKVPYLVMELVHGQTLFERIQTRGPLSGQETIAVFRAMASALLYAEQMNIIHRDIKPANIILITDTEGDITGAKLIDFGLSKNLGDNEFAQSITATGEVFGSPFYMSPEHWNGEPVNASSDLYSLGISLFESLSGAVPFYGENAFTTAMMHSTAPVPSLGRLPDPPANFQKWDLILQKLLAKLPEDRYQHGGELGDDLNRLSLGLEIKAMAVRQSHAMTKKVLSTDKILWAVISFIFLLLILLSSVMLNSMPQSNYKQTTKYCSEFDHIIANSPNAMTKFDITSETMASGKRVLYFPQVSLGNFKSENKQFQARGRVELPLNSTVCFAPNELFLRQPELFKKFGPQDITSLCLQGCPVDVNDQNLENISGLTGLRSIEIRNCALTGKSVATLNLLPHLTCLYLLDTEIVGTDLKNFARLQYLEALVLNNMKEVHDLLPSLRENQNLKILILKADFLEDRDLGQIAAIPQLETLVLSNNQLLSTAGLTHLSRLKSLKQLHMPHILFTADCALPLAKISKLRDLKISISHWSSPEINSLKKALPTCRISS